MEQNEPNIGNDPTPVVDKESLRQKVDATLQQLLTQEKRALFVNCGVLCLASSLGTLLGIHLNSMVLQCKCLCVALFALVAWVLTLQNQKCLKCMINAASGQQMLNKVARLKTVQSATLWLAILFILCYVLVDFLFQPSLTMLLGSAVFFLIFVVLYIVFYHKDNSCRQRIQNLEDDILQLVKIEN